MNEEHNAFDERVIPAYGKINGLGHPSLEHLLDDEVIVQEKVDGSQFSFGVLDGILRCRSSGREIFMDAPDKMFTLGVEYVKRIQDRLVPNWIYRSEFLRKPGHNTLVYSRTPHNHIALYDVMVGHQQFLEHWNLPVVAKEMDIEAVPCFAAGRLDLEKFQEYMSRESFLGGQQIEGLVIKNYRRFDEHTGKVLMGKYVSEKFKEVHRKVWGENNPGRGDIVASIIAAFKTSARWEKAVYYLRDAGTLEDSARDIGNLVKRAQIDIEAECKEEIQEMLWKGFHKEILRAVVKGLPEWYKERLMNEQFDKEN